MKREEELNPCPFCGSSAHVEQYGDARQSTKYQCDDCGCMLETGEEWDFGRDWNRRALIPTPKPKPEEDVDWFSQVVAFFVKHGMLDERDEYDIRDIMAALHDNYAPEATEGVDRQDRHSKPVVSQTTQIVEDNATEGGTHEKALMTAYEEFNRIACERITETRSLAEVVERCHFFADRGAVAIRAALTAKQTDGRGGNERYCGT